jgi:hypothetical protein
MEDTQIHCDINNVNCKTTSQNATKQGHESYTKKRRAPCPKGERFNKKTQRCERKQPEAKQPEPVVEQSEPNKPIRRAPCPKGERFNKKTQRCEPKRQEPIAEPIAEPVVEPVVEESEPNKPIRRAPCPKGERFNKKTQRCEPKRQEPIAEPVEEPVVEPVVEESEPNKPIRRAPCPKGERFNKKTQRCEPKRQEPVEEPVEEPIAEPVAEPIKPIRRTPCPKGERFNKKTQRCEPKRAFNIEPTEALNTLIPTVVPKRKVTKKVAVAQTQIADVPEPEPSQTPLSMEKREHDILSDNPVEPYLYPHLNDPNFNTKIADREEFHATQYDGSLHAFKERANELCGKKSEVFELMPHQLFVKNFMSRHTPYSSILLYHGLGTGKTCSAIGIAEETRKYNRQSGMNRKIFVIAAPNVQDNFRSQLFHEDKLLFENGVWNLNTCIGNTLLQEINVQSFQRMQKTAIVKSIHDLIHKHYRFMGYRQFANYIHSRISVRNASLTKEEKSEERVKNIHRHFNDAMIIIDEVHNVHQLVDDEAKDDDEEPEKRGGARRGDAPKSSEEPLTKMLMEISTHANNVRFVLMSATPIFNSQSEIIWLVNLMNMNDRRPTITIKDVFDKQGGFVQASSLNPYAENGDDLLRRKLVGYVSFVRGENPYIFPYRIYPEVFATKEHLLNDGNYPKLQMSGTPLNKDQRIQYVPVYIDNLSEDSYQGVSYKALMNGLVTKLNVEEAGVNIPAAAPATSVVDDDEEDEDIMKGGAPVLDTDVFGFKTLRPAVQALNIVFPGGKNTDVQELIGVNGLQRCITWKKGNTKSGTPIIKDFKYVSGGIEVFHPKVLGKYSVKIDTIMRSIEKSSGIVLIYTKYVFSGAVPLALALEERGFNRYCSNPEFKNLMDNKPAGGNAPSYVMITGNRMFSPSNADDVNYLTSTQNKNGEKVKVVIITDAGSEGLDFKNIRQVHILDPWYNMNKIEQIIGRGVRNFSHCGLDFEDRNVEIYMHAVLCGETETADLYMYRLAERKAVRAGKITRIMKESSVDCLLNQGQRNFSQNIIQSSNDVPKGGKVSIRISSQTTPIQFSVGDRDNSYMCDYMTCEYHCVPTDTLMKKPSVETQYTTDFLTQKQNNIMRRIRDAFRDKSVYHRNMLFRYVNTHNKYTMQQFLFALTTFIQNTNEIIVNKDGHRGYLVNRGEYYAFQPVEITDESISQFERDALIQVRPIKLRMELQKPGQPDLFNQPPDVSVPETKREDGSRVFHAIVKLCANHDKPKTINSSWYSFANECIEHLFDSSNKFGLGNITPKQRVAFITQHYLENDVIFEMRVSLYSDVMKMSAPKEEMAKLVYDYLREQLTRKMITLDEYQYLFLWNGKYPEKRKLRDDMYKRLSNKLILDPFAECVYVLDKTTKEWKHVSTENGEHIENLGKIQEMLFAGTNKRINASQTFGFSKQGFAVFVQKTEDKNKNKGALCNNKTKEQAMVTLRKDVLYVNDVSDALWVTVSTWLETKLKPMTCVAIELLLQLWDDVGKDGERHYLDLEDLFFYQYANDI